MKKYIAKNRLVCELAFHTFLHQLAKKTLLFTCFFTKLKESVSRPRYKLIRVSIPTFVDSHEISVDESNFFVQSTRFLH